jgi:hypothetical protein
MSNRLAAAAQIGNAKCVRDDLGQVAVVLPSSDALLDESGRRASCSHALCAEEDSLPQKLLGERRQAAIKACHNIHCCIAAAGS